MPAVERVIRVSQEYRILGRHKDSKRITGFDYNGLHFDQETLHIFAGLCAVDSKESVEVMMKALKENKLVVQGWGHINRGLTRILSGAW